MYGLGRIIFDSPCDGSNMFTTSAQRESIICCVEKTIESEDNILNRDMPKIVIQDVEKQGKYSCTISFEGKGELKTVNCSANVSWTCDWKTMQDLLERCIAVDVIFCDVPQGET